MGYTLSKLKVFYKLEAYLNFIFFILKGKIPALRVLVSEGKRIYETTPTKQ